MNIEFSKEAFKDFKRIKTQNLPEYQKIKNLLLDISKNPFEGIGKPEKLKANLSGYFSRRITKEHRLVYSFEDDTIFILSCWYHYD